MFPRKDSKPTTVGPVKCNTCEAQDKDYKIALQKC